MELDYSPQPSLIQKVRPLAQNWRLYAFVLVLAVPFVWVGYTLLNETLSGGIHHYANYTYVDLKSLGNFPIDPINGRLTEVPRDFRDLDGKRVALKGMMWDLRSAGPQTKEFQLVYNIQKCCFNGPPRVQERVFVHVKKSPGVQFYDQLVNAVGTLHVRLKRDDQGTIQSVYDMDLENLDPA